LYVKRIYIKQKKLGCCELIFADNLFLTAKEHTQKNWQASSR